MAFEEIAARFPQADFWPAWRFKSAVWAFPVKLMRGRLPLKLDLRAPESSLVAKGRMIPGIEMPVGPNRYYAVDRDLSPC
jgi:hypothetical protein